MQFLNRARTRRKIFIRIFGINTHFHRMTRQMNITLAQSEFLSRSNANLLFYKIRQSFIKTRLPIGREHIIHLHENLGSLAGSRGFFCFRGFGRGNFFGRVSFTRR